MSGKKISVAVVDDDPSLCRAVRRLLNAVGIDSRAYASAEEFLVQRGEEPPACLLLDVQLTGISGFDLQRRLNADGLSIPVVYITAFDEPVARAEARELGCAAFLLKTDAGELLLDAIQRATFSPADKTELSAPAFSV